MGWRGLVAVAALLATGIVGGFAAASYLEADPVTSGVPTPVSANNPQFPTDPALPVEQDPTEEPMGTDLPLDEVTVGSGTNEFVFPAPVGWKRLDPSSNEVKYKLPGNPTNTYVLRVEQVKSQHETIPDIVKAASADLEDTYADYEELSYTYDSLEFSYLYEGYRRFGFMTWLDISHSGQAEAEIALTGREVDVPGMRELLTKVIRGIREG